MADIARESGIDAAESTLVGASKLFGYLWGVAWQHAEETVQGDADALHDMRVAMRRLRSALQNFESSDDAPLLPEYIRREFSRQRKKLGKLGDALGAVRDFDVLREHLVTYARKRLQSPLTESSGLAMFDQSLQDKRSAAFPRLVKRIHKEQKPEGLHEQFARFALGLPAAGLAPPGRVASPIPSLRDTAHLILPWRVNEILAHAHTLQDAQDAIGHHELRKSLRRLRYSLEALSPCFDEPVKPHLQILIQLQDHLGEMQDREVLRAALYDAFHLNAAPNDSTGENSMHKKQPQVIAASGDAAPDASQKTAEAALPEDVKTFLAYNERRRRRLLGQARALWNEQQERNFPQSLAIKSYAAK